MSCMCGTISASVVAGNSLDGTNAGIIGAVATLLAVVALTRRRNHGLYGVVKKCITKDVW